MAKECGRNITRNNERDSQLVSRCSRRRSPIGPFKLEFDLFVVPLSFVLYVELGTSGHVDPFSGHLDLESLARFEGLGQPAQLRYEFGGGVDLLDVSILLFAHRTSLSSLNDRPLSILPCPKALKTRTPECDDRRRRDHPEYTARTEAHALILGSGFPFFLTSSR